MTINSVPTEEFSTNDSLESKVNAILSNVHEHSFYEEDLYDLLHYKVDPIYKNNGVLRIEPLDADQLLASQKRINDATEMKCLFYIKKALHETPTLKSGRTYTIISETARNYDWGSQIVYLKKFNSNLV